MSAKAARSRKGTLPLSSSSSPSSLFLSIICLSCFLSLSNTPISLVLVEQLLHAHESLHPGPHGARLGDGAHRFIAGRSAMGGGIGGGGVVRSCSCCCCCVARARHCCCSRCSGSRRVRPWHQAKKIAREGRKKNRRAPASGTLSLSLSLSLSLKKVEEGGK